MFYPSPTPASRQAKEPSEAEVRLRRAWRRRQLNREVELREVIEVDPFPLAVNVDTPLVQIHKMFAMLCANRMYVMDRRRLVGCLTLQRVSGEGRGEGKARRTGGREGVVGYVRRLGLPGLESANSGNNSICSYC